MSNGSPIWLYRLSSPFSRPLVERNKENIQKMKNRLHCKRRVSAWKLSMIPDISEKIVRRMSKKDLGLLSYRKAIELVPFDDQKIKIKRFKCRQ